MTNRQKIILPSDFEAQLSLSMNREFWSIDNVKLVVKKYMKQWIKEF